MKKLLSFTLVLSLLILSACGTEEKVESSTPPEDAPDFEITVPDSPTTPTPVAPTPTPAPTPKPTPAPVPPKAETLPLREISMESGNLFYKPAAIKLKLNQPVKIIFKNTGIHTFTIDALGINVKLSGGSGSVQFTPKKAGAFSYYCAIPGHSNSGMVGTLVVE